MSDCWSETEDIRPSFFQLSKEIEKMSNETVSKKNISVEESAAMVIVS